MSISDTRNISFSEKNTSYNKLRDSWRFLAELFWSKFYPIAKFFLLFHVKYLYVE